MRRNDDLPVALSVAGSDSGGGAGIQADLLTFRANGVFGTTAITCLTAQSPGSVSAIEALPAVFVREQIDQIHRYFRIGAVKTGMLYNREIISAVSEFLTANPEIPAVVDPVMVATSGAVLLHGSAIEALQSELLPQAALITPNLDEAGVILGQSPRSIHEMREAAVQMAVRFNAPVLLKGGHLEESQDLTDILAMTDGTLSEFTGKRVEKTNTHGSGCTLSSAIAANLACKWPLTQAIGEALTYLRRGLRQPIFLNGQPFIQH
ncbi:MAG: bifunctional hydroxymethylpyrimidine kinase/phosphomethylpyrimidine kinase [Oceanipulchritudo sp.]